MENLTIILTEKEIEKCKEIGLKRSGSMSHADTKNSKNMTPEKPAWWRHYIGALGEYAFAKLTNQEVHDIIGRGDEGTDFPCGTNVKSSDFPHREPNLLIHKKTSWDRKRAKRYVLAWIKLPQIIFLGEITEQKILNLIDIVGENIYREYGRGKTLTIPTRMLEPINMDRYKIEN